MSFLFFSILLIFTFFLLVSLNLFKLYTLKCKKETSIYYLVIPFQWFKVARELISIRLQFRVIQSFLCPSSELFHLTEFLFSCVQNNFSENSVGSSIDFFVNKQTNVYIKFISSSIQVFMIFRLDCFHSFFFYSVHLTNRITFCLWRCPMEAGK